MFESLEDNFESLLLGSMMGKRAAVAAVVEVEAEAVAAVLAAVEPDVTSSASSLWRTKIVCERRKELFLALLWLFCCASKDLERSEVEEAKERDRRPIEPTRGPSKKRDGWMDIILPSRLTSL